MKNIILEKVSYCLNNYWDGKFPVNPIIIARELGVDIYTNENIEYNGVYVRSDDETKSSHIFVKENDITKTQRYMIAHLLGYHIFTKEKSVSCNIIDIILNKEDNIYKTFASELLLPNKYFNILMID